MNKTSVLLVNLGSPSNCTPWAVFRYLVQFLTDPLVIREPFWKRQWLVRGLIAPLRCWESARGYKLVWTAEGAPLLVWGKRVQALLQEALGPEFDVRLAMRYQRPSIQEALKKPHDRMVVVPLFPQYAGSTTGSVIQEVLPYQLNVMQLKPDHPTMIRAMADQVPNDFDHLLMSFHGLPLSHSDSAEYRGQCCKTAEALAKALNIDSSQYTVAFQSRLGKEPWLEPYTTDVLRALAGKKIAVVSPSFVADCLETTFELGIDYRERFGEGMVVVPCMNDHPLWIRSLKEQILDFLQL